MLPLCTPSLVLKHPAVARCKIPSLSMLFWALIMTVVLNVLWCVLQGMVTNMQSSPSLSQQQMSQIISAGSFSHKQAQLQPNTIPLSHGKVR